MEIFLQTVSSVNDETRVKILHFINIHKELCVCDIESSFEMIQSRISRHLKILKDAGFLKVNRRGKWAYYSIRTPLDIFRQNILKEIEYLNLELPNLKKACEI
ncbi:HTH-type transcriptional repressor AseR [Aliarcobacter thereius]|uniref:Winged helix-turn-helix transcriptional regulator n=2 Tax=Aliarcobacter thereius TaxID=544718 RepID=A0A5R9H7Q6_9BACT|nr:metalloregulator ArsR/SmtB family transcription factor [Aliarcobacter thereius]OCL88575.1 HTH-type transcriptional repressor AseR [Aliarcobacter thereius]OCL94835.1 HTH-type transcriptional repressor AseR [Aliarcobacter thereius LMG 24486]QBF15291.1 transcriptional regulator, ArsR family [Aliarcobacter thereius LMG 24486]TLS72488.1 winged helix-turn-helix transcriptional regulator [Aliarcobacter thereius]TLS92029.1 winged helix-turn-helix transcriptional regulator [Aliarcobacter thereius]